METANFKKLEHMDINTTTNLMYGNINVNDIRDQTKKMEQDLP